MVRVWTLADGETQLVHLAAAPAGTVAPPLIAVAADGRHIAATRGAAVWVGDASGTGRVVPGLDGALLAFAPDGKTLAVAGGALHPNEITLCEIGSGALRSLSGHTQPVRRILFLSDGRLVSAGDDRALRIWELASGTSRALHGHDAAVNDLAATPDGSALASAGDDCMVRLWDPSSGASRVFSGHRDKVARVLFAPDGKTLASGGRDEEVRLWTVADGAARLLKQAGPLGDLAFSSDGALLATTASSSRRVQLWTVATGSARDLAEDDTIAQLAFLPGGQLLALAGRNGSIIVRDIPSSETSILTGHRAPVVSMSLSRDGALLASLSDDGGARLWPLAAPADQEDLRRWLDRATDAVIGEGDRLKGR